MPLYKFKEGDILRNTIKAYPSNYFLLTSGSIYYNNINPELRSIDSGSQKFVLHKPSGTISLYEMNVDRPVGDLVYPFLTKNGGLSSFKTISTKTFQTSNYGDELSPLDSKYPLTSSIAIDFYNTSSRNRIKALKNTLNYYSVNSRHYTYNSALGDKETQDIKLISIPSIFYGSSLKKGSVRLRFYVSGSLVGELVDSSQNGELRQRLPQDSNSGSVAGVVLYNEGFVLLTGSWNLDDTFQERYVDSNLISPAWKYWGSRYEVNLSSSWDIDFKGTSYTPVMTMLAHAPKGELNFSNNPTFVKSLTGSTGNITSLPKYSSSFQYAENPKLELTNTVSSSYTEPSASFKKQTYISKVGIFDKDKNLIAVAKVATPIKKTEQREFTFKLKLDL